MEKKRILTSIILMITVLALISALSACNHSHNPIHMDANEGSCTEKGNIECWYCSGCDKYFTDEDCSEELEENEVFTEFHHNWGQWMTVTAATCSTAGIKVRECIECGELENEIIPASHLWGEWHQEVAPTCISDGLLRRECSLNDGGYEEKTIKASEVYHQYKWGSCVYCGKLYDIDSNDINTTNIALATAANWQRYNNKSATTTVTITDAEIALGVDGNTKAASIKASAQIDLVRTWKDGVLTIDITAKPTKIDLAVNVGGDMTGTVKDVLSTWVNLDKLTGIEFKGQVFYNYGSEEKTIGIRNLSVTGLASAFPALKEENAIITDEAWAIKFDTNGDCEYENEASYNLSSLDLANDPTIGAILSILFKEGYNLDLIGIIEGLLLNQTMLDFSNASNAVYANNHYENSGLRVTENFNFISEVWDQISDKEAVNALLDNIFYVKIGSAVLDIPVADILKQFIGKDTLANLLPDLLAKIEGNMTVSGDVAGGVFTNLDATISGTKITLNKETVNTLVDEIATPLLASIENIPSEVDSIIDQVLPVITEGTAYISLGTIVVDSDFMVIN